LSEKERKKKARAFFREGKRKTRTKIFFWKLCAVGKKRDKTLSFFLKRPLHHHHHHRPSISSRTIIDDQPKRLLSMREQDAGNLSSNICAREYLVECPNIISRVDRERERERERLPGQERSDISSLSSLCFLAIVFSLEALSSRLV